MNGNVQKRTFGDTLFSGSRFIFWSLGPLFLLVAAVLLVTVYVQFAAGRFAAAGVAAAACLVCVSFFLALLNGPYFWWAGRVVAASVFGAYLWYLLDTWLIHPTAFGFWGPRSAATPWNAVCGLLIIGLPCLCYTFFGRFTFRRGSLPDESFSDPEEDEDLSIPEKSNENSRTA
jgi:hypothetical protein